MLNHLNALHSRRVGTIIEEEQGAGSDLGEKANQGKGFRKNKHSLLARAAGIQARHAARLPVVWRRENTQRGPAGSTGLLDKEPWTEASWDSSVS